MILHLDMDAFFASIEQMDNPHLRGKPVIVGGQQRGVVATASYEARKYGIHSAMPTATARRLCPHGIFLRGRGSRYSEVSHNIMSCLRNFSPLIQVASIDEAYLDIRGLGRIHASPTSLAYSIKDAIASVTGGLTCSIGIAPVKFLAKICSDINKPDGLYILAPAKVDNFLNDLPVARLPGVGTVMEASLRSYGVLTVKDLRQLSAEFLCERYGKCGMRLYERARGIDPRQVHDNLPPKSESSEKTFSEDIYDRNFLNKALLLHAERVGQSLRKRGLAGHTITIKIKFADFRQITRSRTIAQQINSTLPIYKIARELLRQEPLPKPVRLLGLTLSGFEQHNRQLRLPGLEENALTAGDAQRHIKVDTLIDDLRQRFGKDIIGRASIRDLAAPDPAAHNFE